MEFRYKALASSQTKSEKKLLLFSASALEINIWAGIPQKKRVGEKEETTGFQREENPKRIEDLRDFFLNQDNIIQNPLLCSMRDNPLTKVEFHPYDNNYANNSVIFGDVVIQVPDFNDLNFEQLFRYVREYIESRLPELAQDGPSQELINQLRQRAADTGEISLENDYLSEGTNNRGSYSESSDDNGVSAALFEESHIKDFWEEVAARHELIKQIEGPIEQDKFLGFDREVLISYLKPMVLVDGQHRLRGALNAADSKLSFDHDIQSEIEERIANGENVEDVKRNIRQREARLLPISFLMDSDPAEQVFQFVVVNQKATPVGRALLGTIVSTTLSNSEMNKVATRLKNASIPVEESQAITYLARHPDSPFKDLIERGLAGTNKDVLQWNVFSSIVSIFKDLKGGKAFEGPDYASLWGSRYLPYSNIVSDYEQYDFNAPIEYWSKLDGPWRDVFVKFWTEVKDELGSNDPNDYNYWGKTRDSNLFNKVSLTILAADFFQFLNDKEFSINTVDDIPRFVEKWLQYVNKSYFNKDFGLRDKGVKKDSTGIRKRWARLWIEHRKVGGNLPDRRLFSQPISD